MPVAEQLAENRQRLEVRNPYDGSVVGYAPVDGEAEVANALRTVKSYAQGLSPEERSATLRRAAELLARERDEFALLMTKESGNCLKDSWKEVERSVRNLRLAAEEASRLHGEALRFTAGANGKVALTLYEPVGVVSAITPFNRPLNQVVVKVAPAIASNNAIIVKPSEKTPLTALAFADLFHRAGLPANMLQVVTGEPKSIGKMLIQSPLVDMISFTGGVKTGQLVARLTGMKKLALELGGNDPFIVLENADLAKAAKIAADGATATAGQACRGIKRIIVQEQIADTFASLLVEQVKRKRCGDPLDPETDVGSVIDEAAAIRAEKRCRAAEKDGAVLLYGGKRCGTLVEPTVLDHVSSASELVTSETFAPIAPIIRVENLDEAIKIANGTAYGLQAGVATRDFEAFMKLATRLQVGAVNLMEGPNFDSPLIPFGGVKQSGIGREGIRYAMREMAITKTVLLPWENAIEARGA